MSSIVFSRPGRAALVFEDSAEPPACRWSSFEELPGGPRLREFSYPGIDGADALRLGAAPREFLQRGLLLAADESGLATLAAAVRAAADGAAGTLAVRGGAETFSGAVLASARFFDHGRADGSFIVRYELRWKQLAP